MSEMRTRCCKKCGWVYMGVTLAHAEREVASFNEYYDRSDQKTRDMFGDRKSHIDDYKRCRCGNIYTNFRDAVAGDCPDGCTINPILLGDT